MIEPELPLFLFTVAAAGLLLPWGTWRWLRRDYRRFITMTPVEREARQTRLGRWGHRLGGGCLAVMGMMVLALVIWVAMRHR